MIIFNRVSLAFFHLQNPKPQKPNPCPAGLLTPLTSFGCPVFKPAWIAEASIPQHSQFKLSQDGYRSEKFIAEASIPQKSQFKLSQDGYRTEYFVAIASVNQ
jgi:hypothetical protein